MLKYSGILLQELSTTSIGRKKNNPIKSHKGGAELGEKIHHDHGWENSEM